MKKELHKPNTVDEYIALFDLDTQKKMIAIRKIILELAPKAEEKISYKMPAYFLNGHLVYFAAFKNHIGFYALPSGNEAFQIELSFYKTGKGSIQFPLKEPTPLNLIKKIVQYRIEENLLKKKK